MTVSPPLGLSPIENARNQRDIFIWAVAGAIPQITQLVSGYDLGFYQIPLMILLGSLGVVANRYLNLMRITDQRQT